MKKIIAEPRLMNAIENKNATEFKTWLDFVASKPDSQYSLAMALDWSAEKMLPEFLMLLSPHFISHQETVKALNQVLKWGNLECVKIILPLCQSFLSTSDSYYGLIWAIRADYQECIAEVLPHVNLQRLLEQMEEACQKTPTRKLNMERFILKHSATEPTMQRPTRRL